MFRLTLKKKLMLYGAAAVLPLLFIILLFGGGGSTIDQAEQVIEGSGVVIEKVTTTGGITLPYSSIDGKSPNACGGELRLHCSQGFTASGVMLSLEAMEDVIITIYSVTEKTDNGETVEEILQLAKVSVGGGSIKSLIINCTVDMSLNFMRLKITDNNGALVNIELYALGFKGLQLKN